MPQRNQVFKEQKKRTESVFSLLLTAGELTEEIGESQVRGEFDAEP